MKKRLSILAAILLLTVFAALLLMSWMIIEQNEEILALTKRTHNLEVIVSYELGNIHGNFTSKEKAENLTPLSK